MVSVRWLARHSEAGIKYAALLVILLSSAASSQTIRGPVSATVNRVIDGDTLDVDAKIWPDLVVKGISVRVDGIDTPERRGKCEQEKNLAETAKRTMAELFPAGSEVYLQNVRNGKFAGRVLADVSNQEAGDWAKTITDAGLAVEYHGKGEKNDWCSTPTK